MDWKLPDTSDAAWANAVHAMPNGPFVQALSLAVTNDGNSDGAARWILTQVIGWARDHGEDYSAFDAFDGIVWDIEQLDRFWPIFDHLDFDRANLPALARFIFERIPAVSAEVSDGHAVTDDPFTKALVIADRAHDLAALFSVGLKPNGSKDPYALRRAAKHLLWALLPRMPERTMPEPKLMGRTA